MSNPFSNIAQKAFYLGMGLASVATEKAGSTLLDLKTQATKLAEELVERGEMTTEEAKKLVDDLMRQKPETKDTPAPPRTITIDDDLEGGDGEIDNLRQQVAKLQEELRKIQS